MSKNVLVAGGASSLVYGNLARKLSQHGIKIGWHVSDIDGDPFTGIPMGCEGVVIVRDMIGHDLFHKLTDLTRPSGLPTATIPRKWSHAEAILRMQGILDPVTNGGVPGIGITDVMALAIQYIISERQDGRNPKRAEVEAAVQRAYGRHVTIDAAKFEEAHARASQTAAAPVPVDPDQHRKEINDWVTLLIEEDPGRVLDPTGVAVKVAGHCKASKDAILVDVLACVEAIRTQWKSRDKCDLEWRQHLMHQWFVDWFRRAYATGEDWPDYNTTQERCRQVFGVLPKWDNVKRARVEALGEWATTLFSTPGHAPAYVEDQYPNLHLDIPALVASKAIPAARTGTSGWFLTSAKAIDDYVAQQRQEAEAASVRVLNTPPPTPVPAPTEPQPKVQDTKPDLKEMALEIAVLIEDRILGHLKDVQDRLTKIETQLRDLIGRPQAPPASASTVQDVVADIQEIRVILRTSQTPR